MKNNSIDNGLSNGLNNPSTFVGSANGMQNSEQQISDVNTFIFTVKSGASSSAIVLPLVSTGTYNFWIDWGDGNKDFVKAFSQVYSAETAVRTHTYSVASKIYTVKITGVCRGWSYIAVPAEQPKLLSIERFGCLELIDDLISGQQFYNCTNLDLSNVKDTLSTKYLTSTLSLFLAIPNLNINLINNWDISRITSMVSMFSNCTNFKNQIGGWNTSNVTNMSLTLANSSINVDVSSWNTSAVTTFSQIFTFNTAFNQPIGSWNVSSANNMYGMFYSATAFSQPLSNWERSTVGDTSTLANVTIMTLLFRGANAFNQDISNWNVGNVTAMDFMFNVNTIYNQPLNAWNVSKVTNMASMFNGATAFNQPLNSWNTGAVTGMASMFNGATAFNQDIGSWNVSNVTSSGFANFMAGKTPSTFSAANLDSIYNGWSSRTSASNASISFGTANYTTAGGSAGRAILIGRGWTIVDGGGI